MNNPVAMPGLSIHQRRAQVRDEIRRSYAADPHLEGDGAYDHPLWVEAMRPLIERLPADSSRRVLDVGCGSGGFSRFLAKQTGLGVLGIDVDEVSVERARQLAEECGFNGKVSQLAVDTEAPAPSFPGEAFEAIVCAKVACHFVDPLATFRSWRRWLATGGIIGVMDGLWQVSGWTGLGHLLDDLPIPCQQTLGTIAYLMEEAGFTMEYRNRLDTINAASKRNDLPGGSGDLYLVVARAN